MYSEVPLKMSNLHSLFYRMPTSDRLHQQQIRVTDVEEELKNRTVDENLLFQSQEDLFYHRALLVPH